MMYLTKNTPAKREINSLTSICEISLLKSKRCLLTTKWFIFSLEFSWSWCKNYGVCFINKRQLKYDGIYLTFVIQHCKEKEIFEVWRECLFRKPHFLCLLSEVTFLHVQNSFRKVSLGIALTKRLVIKCIKSSREGNLKITVWKFHNFSITQMLCEINFGSSTSTSAKSAISTHFQALNFDFD